MVSRSIYSFGVDAGQDETGNVMLLYRYEQTSLRAVCTQVSSGTAAASPTICQL